MGVIISAGGGPHSSPTKNDGLQMQHQQQSPESKPRPIAVATSDLKDDDLKDELEEEVRDTSLTTTTISTPKRAKPDVATLARKPGATTAISPPGGVPTIHRYAQAWF